MRRLPSVEVEKRLRGRSGKLLHKYMYEPIKCRIVGEHRMKGINEKTEKKKASGKLEFY